MKKNILYIGSSQLANMMNKERWLLINAFKRAGHDFIDVDNDKVFNFDLKKLVDSRGKKYDLIIFEEVSWAIKLKFNLFFKNTKKVKIPKATFISDYWIYTSQFRKLLKKNDIKIFLTCHESSYRFIGKYFTDLIEKILWVPLTIDSEEFNFPEQKKKYDFLLSGALTEITPFRKRIVELMKKQNKYRVFHLEHPGHWKKNENKGKRGSDYYKILAQSHFCLSTSGIYNISARKFWEIPAAGSTIFGNQTGHPEHFLIKDNLVELSESMSDKEILDKLDKAYQNKEYWTKTAENSKKLVRKFISNDYTVQRIEEEIGRLSLEPAKPASFWEKLKIDLHKIIYLRNQNAKN